MQFLGGYKAVFMHKIICRKLNMDQKQSIIRLVYKNDIKGD